MKKIDKQQIGKQQIVVLYDYASRLYDGEIEISQAADELEKQGFNKSSAQDYLYNFGHLMNGEEFKRTMNNEALEYFLQTIYAKRGEQFFRNALHAVKLHVDYYEGFGIGKLKGTKKILDKYGYYSENDNHIGERVLGTYYEGAMKEVKVNVYERNPKARRECIDHHKAICCICKFNFKEKYGDIGDGFIHVHHIKDIALVGEEYIVDPIKDLRPVCPNCHAMLHKRQPAYTIEELEALTNHNYKV